MNFEERGAVQECLPTLIQSLDVCSIADELFAKHCITNDQWEKVTSSNGATSAEKVRWYVTVNHYIHYTDVIMTTTASQITSLKVVYSAVYSDADQRKQQSSASLALVWGIHRDRWIPRTKGQLRGKCFHLMTSSCRTWWRMCTSANWVSNNSANVCRSTCVSCSPRNTFHYSPDLNLTPLAVFYVLAEHCARQKTVKLSARRVRFKSGLTSIMFETKRSTLLPKCILKCCLRNGLTHLSLNKDGR